MEERLKTAIERTREYGKRFGVEYTNSEINERLISEKIYKLPIANYQLRINENYKTKMELARKLAKDIGDRFQSILFIGVTGSVAAGRPPENSDIDLMIITRMDSLWITRLVLRLYVKLWAIPHRRYGEKEEANEFCFNLWMEVDNLRLPNKKQNLKNAMDLILMKPILNKNKTYEKFLVDNGWAKKYVATGYSRLMADDELLITNYKTNYLVGLINWLVFWPQWWYMRRKIEGGLVDKKMAFFHPNGS